MDTPFWPVVVEIKVPWRDLDAAGHVNNAVYFSYMETARAEAYLRMKGAQNWREIDMILARATCDFRSAANFGETLRVSVTPGRIGESSFTLHYKITEVASKRLVAEGESVQVTFDYAANKKKTLPAAVRAHLEAGQEKGAA